MNAVKIAAIVLIVAGALGLAYGSFSYTKQTHDINVGPLEMSVKEKQTVNVPAWAGVGAIAIGAALLLLGGTETLVDLFHEHPAICAHGTRDSDCRSRTWRRSRPVPAAWR